MELELTFLQVFYLKKGVILTIISHSNDIL